MSYLYSSEGAQCSCSGSLVETRSGPLSLFTDGLEVSQREALLVAYRENRLDTFLGELANHTFSVILHDEVRGCTLAANDLFGSNELLYALDGPRFWVTDDAHALFGARGIRPDFDIQACIEHLAFYTVLPPRTVYQGVSLVPMQMYVGWSPGKEPELHEYVDPRSWFEPKASSPADLARELDKTLHDSLRADGVSMRTGVALSGGIDSGGLLGIAKDILKQAPSSISVGPHGESSADLASARQTAKEEGSTNTALLPSLGWISGMPPLLRGLNQPISADVFLPYAACLAEAKRQKLSGLVFGLGSEMLLGNLEFGKIYGKFRSIERFIPSFLGRGLGAVLQKTRRITENQKQFLTAASWYERFLRLRAPLFCREASLYGEAGRTLFESLEKRLKILAPQQVADPGDWAVLLYVRTWENYLQRRDVGRIGRIFGVTSILPFDTAEVARALFKTPTKFRKLGRWNKQIIREAFRPYISMRLYERKGKSLVIPYTKMLEPIYPALIEYLRTNALVTRVVDIDRLERSYATLPEPGLTLVRLVGLALWHDVHWDADGLSRYVNVFTQHE